jgi:dCMP deaminase
MSKLIGGLNMRPSWDEYFMQLVEIIKTRSTCVRRQVGAIVVKENRILTTGYNGSPSGCKHCEEIGCVRQKLGIPSGQRHELCRALHAEQNAIIQAAKYGINIDGACIYVTTQPCVICAKMIINSGINRIVYKGEYPDELAMQLLEEANIEVVRLV